MHNKSERSIGIIGGIGPPSTMEYYRLILSYYHERTSDNRNPSILINSIDVKRMLGLVAADRLDELVDYLSAEIKRVADAGATFCILAAGTPHIVFESLQSHSPIPLISIVEETCKHARSLGVRRPGLFATRFTMQGTFYQKVLNRERMSIVTPSPDDQEYIHEKYMTKLKGTVLETTKEKLLRIVERLRKENGIDGLILGGTELSLILHDEDNRSIPFIDTTRIHAQSVVTEFLK